MKASADDILNVHEKLNFGLGRVENSVRKGENAGFSFSYNVLEKLSFSGSLKVRIVWLSVNTIAAKLSVGGSSGQKITNILYTDNQANGQTYG